MGSGGEMINILVMVERMDGIDGKAIAMFPVPMDLMAGRFKDPVLMNKIANDLMKAFSDTYKELMGNGEVREVDKGLPAKARLGVEDSELF